jgi:hypothetical protein
MKGLALEPYKASEEIPGIGQKRQRSKELQSKGQGDPPEHEVESRSDVSMKSSNSSNESEEGLHESTVESSDTT